MAKRKKWTAQQLEANRLKYAENKTTREIGEILEIPQPAVARMMRSLAEYQNELSRC